MERYGWSYHEGTDGKVHFSILNCKCLVTLRVQEGGREEGRMVGCRKGLLNNSKREESTDESNGLVPVSH